MKSKWDKITDRQRFEWFFNDANDKLGFLHVYVQGMRNGWTPEQWRTSIDTAMIQEDNIKRQKQS